MSALLEQLLDAERRAECARHDGEISPLGHFRPLPGQASQAFVWPQVPDRNAEAPSRRRNDPPHPSRFGALS